MHPFPTISSPKNAPETARSPVAFGVTSQPIPTLMRPRKNKQPVAVQLPNRKALVPLKQFPKGYHFPRIYFSNVRSMINKIDEISTLISLNSYDIVVITDYNYIL